MEDDSTYHSASAQTPRPPRSLGQGNRSSIVPGSITDAFQSGRKRFQPVTRDSEYNPLLEPYDRTRRTVDSGDNEKDLFHQDATKHRPMQLGLSAIESRNVHQRDDGQNRRSRQSDLTQDTTMDSLLHDQGSEERSLSEHDRRATLVPDPSVGEEINASHFRLEWETLVDTIDKLNESQQRFHRMPIALACVACQQASLTGRAKCFVVLPIGFDDRDGNCSVPEGACLQCLRKGQRETCSFLDAQDPNETDMMTQQFCEDYTRLQLPPASGHSREELFEAAAKASRDVIQSYDERAGRRSYNDCLAQLATMQALSITDGPWGKRFKGLYEGLLARKQHWETRERGL